MMRPISFPQIVDFRRIQQSDDEDYDVIQINGQFFRVQIEMGFCEIPVDVFDHGLWRGQPQLLQVGKYQVRWVNLMESVDPLIGWHVIYFIRVEPDKWMFSANLDILNEIDVTPDLELHKVLFYLMEL